MALLSVASSALAVTRSATFCVSPDSAAATARSFGASHPFGAVDAANVFAAVTIALAFARVGARSF